MRILILAGKGLLWLIIAAIALFFVASWVNRDRPAARVEAKWAQPPSQFIEVDGLRVHYRDTGPRDGPALVLLHANYANLFMWEPWAAALQDRYRVIRYDLSAHGLTGPDPRRDYTLQRSVTTLAQFVDALQVERFVLVGTSVGGTIAMHYAVKHPERVQRLILISPGSLEKDVRGRNTPPPLPAAADLFKFVTPRALARFLLENGYGDRSRVTDAVVDEWYELWLREGNRQAMLDRLRQYVSGDVEATIGAVSVPVLLLWGEKNPRVPVELAYEFQRLLRRAPTVDLQILPGIGHMAVQEAPDDTARRVRRYLDDAFKTAANVSREMRPRPLEIAAIRMPR
ncbi:MAG: alpha/beta hydrolase [Steroidobacteraceae bacterium]|nr:alpha/beta hydrolase [Steroidobacteraceae bacterium]MDW8260755.1 alpha/beta hydrolase [Gammaproteobacteria bacterium]